MENQEILNLETGTEEMQKLEPKTVKIEKIEVQEVGEKRNKKVVFSVKHPDKEETIQISSVKYEQKGGKLATSGTWVNLDKQEKMQKGSALSNFIAFLNAKVLNELVGKEVLTVEDDKGYLCFKSY